MGAPAPTPERAAMKALLLDDDPYALEFLRAVLSERYPGLEIHARSEPDPTGEYDVYLLDDDFEGVRLAGKLARRIRAQRPEALILAFSASLDDKTLKDLLGAGCNGVCDKRVPSDLPEMLEALDRCMGELAREQQRPPSDLSTRYLLNTFRDLFRAWNQRLDSQE
jgi:DNA-binding NarL/FixJ family response regulator